MPPPNLTKGASTTAAGRPAMAKGASTRAAAKPAFTKAATTANARPTKSSAGPPALDKATSRVLDEKLNRFDFESGELGAGEYRSAGCASFDAPDMLAKRVEIRRSPKLRAAALKFWVTLGKASESETISFEEYRRVHVLLCRALAPELSEEEAGEAAAEDWAEDLGGARKARRRLPPPTTLPVRTPHLPLARPAASFLAPRTVGAPAAPRRARAAAHAAARAAG
jgi:hypothetical protein